MLWVSDFGSVVASMSQQRDELRVDTAGFLAAKWGKADECVGMRVSAGRLLCGNGQRRNGRRGRKGGQRSREVKGPVVVCRRGCEGIGLRRTACVSECVRPVSMSVSFLLPSLRWSGDDGSVDRRDRRDFWNPMGRKGRQCVCVRPSVRRRQAGGAELAVQGRPFGLSFVVAPGPRGTLVQPEFRPTRCPCGQPTP